MATNDPPDLKEKSLAEHVNADALRVSATKAAKLLDHLPNLRVWVVHCKAPSYKDNSWFIGFSTKSEDEPLILNIRIHQSNLIIEFRYPQYLPSPVLDRLKWTSRSWCYASYNDYGESKIAEMIRTYLDGLLPDYRDGKVKAGGKSAAESLLDRLLQQVFPNTTIKRNYRPANLRSPKGRPLEFDLWLPDLDLAIEVQGPQHFRTVYSDNTTQIANDQFKREWCAIEGVKLVWINWEGATKSLFQLPEVNQLQHLRKILSEFRISSHTFLQWDKVGSHKFS